MLKLPGPYLVDFYKWGHCGMIPEGTRVIYSNVTPRSTKYFNHLPDFDGRMVVVGLRRAIDDILELWDEFFKADKETILAEIRLELTLSLPSNARIDECMQHFADLHDLGYLPIRIAAVPEGTRLPMRVPFMTIRNTDDRFAFLTNFLETIISAETWKASVNASTAFEFLTHMTRNAMETVTNNFDRAYELVQYQAHDFSMRGMSGAIDAMNSGIGHLTCFRGTDTLPSLRAIRNHYDVGANERIGGSVVATEHMVMCLGGMTGEVETIRRLIQDLYPTGIVSIVSDTWDFFKVITVYAPALKDIILARTPDSSGLAKTVFRPDSGNPVLILCGDPSFPEGSPEYKGAVECMWDAFGGTVTDQGYKMLHERVGLIYGDSITLDRSLEIDKRLKAKGFCSLSSVRGIGSYTYQMVSRDTFGIAVKATAAIVDGETRNLLKNPKTDDGTKKSATGFLRVVMGYDYPVVGPQFRVPKLVEGLSLEEAEDPNAHNLLRVVLQDGVLAPRPPWDDIRTRVYSALLNRVSA